MWFDNQSEDGSEGRTAGDAKNVGIGKRVAEQSLKAGAGDGQRRADYNCKQNARQADFDHDHGVVAGELAGLAEQNANQVPPEAVERNRNGAEPECDDYHNEQNYSEDAALEEQALQSQRSHAHPGWKENSWR